MPTFPASTYDTFSRNVTASWSTGDNGHLWLSEDEAYYNVDGTHGKIDVSSSTFPTYDTAYIDLTAHDIADQESCEVLALVRWTGSASYPLTDFGPMINRSSGNTFYFARLQGNYGEIAIACYSNGTLYELNRTARSLTKNTDYWVRFKRSGSTLYLKTWTYGTVEPSSWSLESGLYTGATRPAAGDWGVCTRRTTDTHTIQYKAFYGYTLEDDPNTSMPVIDSFDRVTTTGKGWGLSNTKHPWEGHVALDPATRASGGQGTVTNPADGYASLPVSDTDDHVAIIGPSQTGSIETYMEFDINSSQGNTFVYVGLRGNTQVSGGVTQYTGYAVRYASGSTSATLWKKTSFGGAWTQITATTNTAFTQLASNTQYCVRFQVVGTTLSARIWPKGGTEPPSFQTIGTDSSITSGRMWLLVNQTVTTARIVKVYRAEYDGPTVSGTNYTTAGALTMTSATDTQITTRANFTNDTNANNSISLFQYRKVGDSTWTVHGGAKVRTTSTYFTITTGGLEPNTAYQFEAHFADADSVKGTNPATGTFSTTNTGVTPGTLSVTGVTATSVSLRATYLNDTDSDSSAVARYRTSSVLTQVVYDTFVGGPGTLLQNHNPDIGSTWIKHADSNSTGNFELWSGRAYARTSAINTSLLYYNNATPAQAEYDVSCDIYFAADMNNAGIAGRISTAANTYYLVDYSVGIRAWCLYQIVNGVVTSIGTAFAEVQTQTSYNVKLVLKDAYKAVLVDGVEVIRSATNAITAAGKGGIRVFATTNDEGSSTNQPTFDNFRLEYRTNGGTWSTNTVMTADRVNKWFTHTYTGLTSDVIYEFEVTYSDVDGVRTGPNPQSVTAMTTGQAIALQSMGALPQPTSVTIDVFYAFDSNNDSSLAIQYRSTMDYMWTTLSPTYVTVNRTTKKFTALINALRPVTTYEVRAIVTDPNGIIEGSPSELTGLFTTSGVIVQGEKIAKNYLWKVYDPDGLYITTWHDAGEPEFAWHENGGVSDLSVTLSRPLSEVQNKKSGIDYQNRVDVWAFDPSSDGFGLNLIVDNEFNLGSWVLGSGASIDSEGGPDGGNALKIVAPSSAKIVTRSLPFYLFKSAGATGRKSTSGGPTGDPYPLPYVAKAFARARGGKMVMYIEAYDINDNKIDTSDELAETIGGDWQTIRLEYTPPPTASYMRLAFENDGKGTMWADKPVVRPKEDLIYRGRIESFTPSVDQDSEEIEIQILGLVSLLSDDYIEFLQFVTTQPQNDLEAGRPNEGPQDPGEMIKRVIDIARTQNPHFDLYYTTDSIRMTGTPMEYTFRDKQLRACFDKIRELCPPGWHYYVEPDGLIVLRGPEHAPTHKLRLGVEIMNFSVERSIRNLKNYVIVKGRQDEDESEPDGYGSINYVAFDQASIDTYGKRVLHIRDANITDPDTAEFVGNGRLVEYNREEQRAQCNIPDEKSASFGYALRGANIEGFRPGDNVIIFDPVAGPRNTYWDAMTWDVDSWDSSNIFAPLPEPVPIKTVQFHGTYAQLELSERQPSGTGDFGRLYSWLQSQDAE